MTSMEFMTVLITSGLLFLAIMKLITWSCTTRKWREYFIHDACGYQPRFFHLDNCAARCPKCGKKGSPGKYNLKRDEVDYPGWTRRTMREVFPFYWVEVKDD